MQGKLGLVLTLRAMFAQDHGGLSYFEWRLEMKEEWEGMGKMGSKGLARLGGEARGEAIIGM